jgi:hypothetical protein
MRMKQPDAFKRKNPRLGGERVMRGRRSAEGEQSFFQTNGHTIGKADVRLRVTPHGKRWHSVLIWLHLT